MSEEELAQFSEALVQEIWTEMGRNRITSIRALALKMGRNHQYVTARLKHDPKTGKPVPINVVDLYAFGEALGVEPGELIDRAERAVRVGGAAAAVADITRRMGKKAAKSTGVASDEEVNVADLYDKPSAAHPDRVAEEGEVDPDLQ